MRVAVVESGLVRGQQDVRENFQAGCIVLVGTAAPPVQEDIE